METTEVEVDEAVYLDAASLRGLMITARADWDALCWLCWSIGLERIALPTEIVPPRDFAAAVNCAMLRCWRAHDQVRTKGLTARLKNLPAFQWENLSIDALPRALAEIAARQYLERRAMFFWLLFPQNVSPFQNDLRRV